MEPGDKLRDLRENRFSEPLTKAKTAELLRIPFRQSYEKYEDGITKISTNLIGKASQLYKITPDYFLHDCYGKTVFLAPYFKEYNVKKGRLIYEDLEKKSAEIALNRNYLATNFFLFEISDYELENFNLPFSMMETHYNEALMNYKIEGNTFPSKDLAYLINPDSNNRCTTILMTKSKTSDIAFQECQTIYLILERKTQKNYLAFITKHAKHYSIIPFFDVNERYAITNYPYLDENSITKRLEGTNNYNMEVKILEIDDIDVLAKGISIWDPFNNL